MGRLPAAIAMAILLFIVLDAEMSTATKAAVVSTVPVFPQIPSSQGRKRDDFQVLVTVEASKKPRIPIHLIFVHSVSNDELLSKVKKAIEFSSRHLLDTAGDDLLTIWGASSGNEPMVDYHPASEEATEKMESHFKAHIGGSKFQALFQKATEIRSGPERAGAIIVLTDGGSESLSDKVAKLVKETNYPVHTFGLSSRHNPKALHRIASASISGTYSFVDDANLSNISTALAVCLGRLKDVVVPGTSVLKLEAAAGVKIKRIQYGVSAITPTGTEPAETIKIGMLHAGETKKIVVHLDVEAEGNEQSKPQDSSCGAHTLLTASFFRSSGDSAPAHKRAVCVERPQDVPAMQAAPSALVLQHIVRLELMQIMVELSNSATSGTELANELEVKWATFVQDHKYWNGVDVLLGSLQEEIDAMKVYARSYHSTLWAAYITSWISSYQTQRPTAMGAASNVVGGFLTQEAKIMVQVAIQISNQKTLADERNCFDVQELAELISKALKENKLRGKPCREMATDLASLELPR